MHLYVYIQILELTVKYVRFVNERMPRPVMQEVCEFPSQFMCGKSETETVTINTRSTKVQYVALLPLQSSCFSMWCLCILSCIPGLLSRHTWPLAIVRIIVFRFHRGCLPAAQFTPERDHRKTFTWNKGDQGERQTETETETETDRDRDRRSEEQMHLIISRFPSLLFSFSCER